MYNKKRRNIFLKIIKIKKFNVIKEGLKYINKNDD